MAKTRIKTFRRNSRRKRNTRRKIRGGGGPISKMLPLLERYLMDPKVSIMLKHQMLEKYIDSLAQEAGINSVGSLIKSRYVIQRKKIKEMGCVKKNSLRSFMTSETQECNDAFTEFDSFKKKNQTILTTTERFKLRHKTFGGLNSRILSMILFNSIRNWNLADKASDNDSKKASNQSLLKFFSSGNIELPKLTDADKQTLRENTNTTKISQADLNKNSDKVQGLISEMTVNTSEDTSVDTSVDTSESSSVNTSEIIPKREEHDYNKFLTIIGLNQNDTISEAEFDVLVNLDNTKKKSGGGDVFEDIYNLNKNLYDNGGFMAWFVFTIYIQIPVFFIVLGGAIGVTILRWVFWIFSSKSADTTESNGNSGNSYGNSVLFWSVLEKVGKMFKKVIDKYKDLVLHYKDEMINEAKQTGINDDIFNENGEIKTEIRDENGTMNYIEQTFSKESEELFKPISEYIFSWRTTGGGSGMFLSNSELDWISKWYKEKQKEALKAIIKPTLQGTIKYI